MNISLYCDTVEASNGSEVWTYREMLQDMKDSGQFAGGLQAHAVLVRAGERAGIDVFEATMTADEWCDMVVSYYFSR